MAFDAVIGYVAGKLQLRLNNKLSLACIEKQASIAYEHIDNPESFMLLKETMEQYPSRVNTAYNDALNVLGLVVRFVSIMMIFAANGMAWMGLVVLLVSVPMVVVTYRNGTAIYRFYKEEFPGKMEMYHSTYILKDRSVVDERTLFGFTDKVNARWREMQYELYGRKKKVNARIVRTRYLARFVNIFAAILIITFMTVAVVRGTLSTGLYLSLVTNIIALIDEVITGMMSLANNVAQEREFLKNLDIVCNYRYDMGYLCLPDANPVAIKSVEFVDVSFSYSGTERKVLDHVSFRMRQGVHYAFVGPNGAGKSTIIKLLTGLYDGYEGSILVNGKNLRDYTQAERKGMFGIIYQDYARYELTLRDSVRIGAMDSFPNGDDGRYLQAISDAGLTELLHRLPKGSDTPLGKTEESGQDISGGEWQRVAIARLLMKQSNFMVLDEPTAALDPTAESRLYGQSLSISKDKTTLLISHRLGSIKTVDYIFVVDGGKIVESGTHAALSRQAGLYQTMYAEQKEWYK